MLASRKRDSGAAEEERRNLRQTWVWRRNVGTFACIEAATVLDGFLWAYQPPGTDVLALIITAAGVVSALLYWRRSNRTIALIDSMRF